MNWSRIQPDPSLAAKMESFRCRYPLGFGEQVAPVVAFSTFEDGDWTSPALKSLSDMTFSPLITGLHYGQSIFEGMKAWSPGGKGPFLFRPEKNAERFRASARRMAMKELPEELFLDAVFSLVWHLRKLIPTGPLESLYIRPLLFASEEGFFLRPANRYTFVVMASPCGGYFSSENVTALIDRKDCRAAPGGTGSAKAAGNYGGSFRSGLRAKSLGFQQTLWLDALEKKYIEEFSGMNFFAFLDDTLVTPKLTDTILPGVTREAVLRISESLGYKTLERRLGIDEVLSAVKEKRCKEIFACGTAAVINPITALGEEDGSLCQLPPVSEQKVWLNIREALTGVQNGDREDLWGYRVNLQELKENG